MQAAAPTPNRTRSIVWRPGCVRAFISAPHGVLYVSDKADNAVYAVHGTFLPGSALVAVTPADAVTPPNPTPPNSLGSLNLWTGAITPVTTQIQAKGLLYVANHEDQSDQGGDQQ